MAFRDLMNANDRLTYRAAREEYARRGVFPTVRELGAALGLSSAQTIQRRLLRLQAAGVIERDRRYAQRGWRFRDQAAPPTYQQLQEENRLLRREVEALRCELRGKGVAA